MSCKGDNMLEFKVGHLAETFGVHRNTVRNWIKNGLLQATPAPGKKYAMDITKFRLCLLNLGVNESKLDAFILENQNCGQLPKIKNEKSKSSDIKNEVPMTTQPLGSVTVVGGGIAGIQAAIDLADSGYYVYLIEKSPGIGGGMAKLDKTFPTNDCAM